MRLPLFFLLLCIGCGDHLPESLGPARKIIVLADSTDWQTLEDPLRENFLKPLSIRPRPKRVL